MADHSTTRPNAPAGATPSPVRARDGASGSSVGTKVSVGPTNDAVDALGATVAGEVAVSTTLRDDAPVPAQAKAKAGEASVIARVIPVGTPSRAEEAILIGAATDGPGLTRDGDGTPSVSTVSSKRMHAQTLAGLAPPPELAAAAAAAEFQAAAAFAKLSPSNAPPKLPLPPARPGIPQGKPGSTPPPPNAALRPVGPAPGFGPPPRPGASQPPRMAFQPPPLPPAMGVPALRPSTPAPPAAGFVAQDPNAKRASGAMAAVTPPPPAVDPRRTNQAMPAIAPPPVPGDPRRTNQALPAIAPPPVPGDPRRTNQALPAIAPPPVPGDPRRTNQAMAAVTPPPAPTDPRRSAQAMPAVTPPPPAPIDPRRSSQAMPAVTPPPAPTDPRRSAQAMPAVTPPPPAGDAQRSSQPSTPEGLPEGLSEAILSAKLPTGTIPMINTAPPKGSSPAPAANPERVESAFSNPAPPRIIYAPSTVLGGKYRLERPLGQGGMGAVWVVRNLSLDADFALKLIRRDRATEEAAARLLTEARAAAKLGHPGIVRVFDFGQTEVGDPYLVMELLTGDSLGELITRKKRLEPGVAVQMLLPVAAALSAAHAKGIVHRDLKPDNIMLSTEESSRKLVPKVLDFGIARVLRDDIDRHQTMAGEVLGSPDYMSPEQARGQLDIDHRTDIWTFAVLLYESITGKRPFEGHNYNALIASIVSNPPMPIHAFGIADAELSGIIDRGLSKSPSARWQTMRDMGVALANWAVDHGIDNDISGVSIQTEWLASQAPRMNLKTLAPAQLPRVAVPGAEPQVAQSTAPVVAREATEWPGLRGDNRKKKWIIGTVLFAVFVGVFIGVSTSSIFSNSTTPTVDGDAGTTPPTPSASARVEPTTTATTPSPATSDALPQPSARTSATTKTPLAPAGPTVTPRRKAPPVPTNIKF